MMWKTHLAINLAVAIFFWIYFNKPLIFIPIVLFFSLFPDIDSRFSYLGKRIIFRPLQLFFGHRGIIHSYTMCIAFSILMLFLYPVFALPVFIGYCLHLFVDSFTIQGIKPFWPSKIVFKGPIKTGGIIDKAIFFSFAFIDIFLLGSIIYFT